jgi:hypothetical protein
MGLGGQAIVRNFQRDVMKHEGAFCERIEYGLRGGVCLIVLLISERFERSAATARHHMRDSRSLFILRRRDHGQGTVFVRKVHRMKPFIGMLIARKHKVGSQGIDLF